MAAIICLTLLVVLWLAAAIFWLADTPDPRAVADVILHERTLEEPAAASA